MAKTINLTQVVVHRLSINPAARSLAVEYSVVDDRGIVRERGEATFWETLPTDATSPNWYELPKGQTTTLFAVADNVGTQLTSRILS